MQISITESGLVKLDSDGDQFFLSKYEAYELFAWLSDHRDWLRGKDDLQPVPSFQENAGTCEPWLEDCPHCKGAHLLGTVDMCPRNPNRPEWVKHLETTE